MKSNIIKKMYLNAEFKFKYRINYNNCNNTARLEIKILKNAIINERTRYFLYSNELTNKGTAGTIDTYTYLSKDIKKIMKNLHYNNYWYDGAIKLINEK